MCPYSGSTYQTGTFVIWIAWSGGLLGNNHQRRDSLKRTTLDTDDLLATASHSRTDLFDGDLFHYGEVG
jgi:hypothetical protein